MRRLTIRARLTVLYGGLLLVAGAVLVAVMYVLVGQRLPTTMKLLTRTGPPGQAPTDVDQLYAAELPAKLRDAALDDMLTTGIVALVLVTTVAVAFGWLLAGRALQPLHRITETAHRIAAAPAADRGCTSGSRWPGRPTRSKSWPTRSTRCWNGWTAPSTASAASSPTPRTSCAPRSR
ncbi:hypothetical protein [Phytohabitans houttuyneae]|uniref:HAMP domain-containing protein n=1 Tax=Phytohabitans houttuyneae TaxID=1076126 RepID=A0A6V8KGR0_9ACTN|nr:hypothetical protein [Phytohabitans houttuyneae]GFJ84423.1 hypothetical protein Phou_086030 [Phytohabitans houttuyneae]